MRRDGRPTVSQARIVDEHELLDKALHSEQAIVLVLCVWVRLLFFRRC